MLWYLSEQAVAKRSPILGFNHNFRHRGLIFHVQTEDSGLNNPHIFTHLFNGGVILSSRKLTYDSGAAEEVVKALMQAQHKAMLKDLKRGDFDGKIEDYFGDNPNLVGGPTHAAALLEETEPQAELPEIADIPQGLEQLAPDDIDDLELELELDDVEMLEALAQTHAEEIALADEIVPLTDIKRSPFDSVDLSANPMDTLRGPAPPRPVGETPSGAVMIHAAAPESAPEPPGSDPQSPGQYSKHTGKMRRITENPFPDVGSAPTPAPPQLADSGPAGKTPLSQKRSRSVTQPLRPSTPAAPGSKPSVIVGAPPKVIGNAPARPQPRRAREQASSSLFGKDLISEKSLDEVILAYLSEDPGAERE